MAALPLRTRPDFETSRALCGLAQNSAHSELTPNFAAQAANNLLLTLNASNSFLCRRRYAKVYFSIFGGGPRWSVANCAKKSGWRNQDGNN
ncbi:hypothetical protein ACFQHW_01405 [Lapidilactobacillus achengensis]|uniref:Uncharacterized protein n=1 Tax=Lapidilactobacillus achengensis TaxID=2486000 RepID=A0ABW1UMW5_9LACO|nr:hypothetical protein [Lapidilactobacillus achengensis]